MQKKAYEHYTVDPWSIIEETYDPKRNEVSEAIFSLANEYMGIRGIIDEGVSADSLIGAYYNGVYEVGEDEHAPAYKGIVRDTHFMVNSVNWLSTTITAGDEHLDLATSNLSNYRRELNMKKGLLTRTFDWTLSNGKTLTLTFSRFLHMKEVYYAYQRIEFSSSAPIDIVLTTALDSTTVHWGKTNYWNTNKTTVTQNQAEITNTTITTNLPLFSGYNYTLNTPCTVKPIENEQYLGHTLKFTVKDETVTFTKNITNVASKVPLPEEDIITKGQKYLSHQPTFEDALADQRAYWDEVWQQTDIEIGGDAKNQQGIRFCIFQLQQTYQGYDKESNIGAKGLTGEAYSGHAFWDTETYCLPFFLLNNTHAAKNLLLFRHKTLDAAKKRARDLDCQGAAYPIATLNGHEASTLWQHSNLQIQPSTAVSYAIWHYMTLTNDQAFMNDYGFDMLLEISRFLLSRGDYNAKGDKFGYYGVMGPDEFQMMVHHNAYTNYMAKRTLEYTLEIIDTLDSKTLSNHRVTDEEQERMHKAASLMYIPKDDKTGIYEQHEGFFDLPHIDIKSIPMEEFPLYHNWSYDRIYRNDMIKQPDVLMFMFLYNQSFSDAEKRVNYDFYEPKTIHESSLSPSIHSIFALELDKMEEAVQFFRFATRMDLDDYNRNTNEGLHTTSIAAAWMNIVYGFGGIRTDGEKLIINPKIPDFWDHYRFNINYKQRKLSFHVTKDIITITNEGESLDVLYHDKPVTLKKQTTLKRL